jgi:outer membrane protein TolC
MSRIALACALLLSLPAAAQRALTLGEALELARTRNKDLRSARSRVEQAAASVRIALVPLLPTVAMNGKYTHNYKEVTLDLSAQQAAGQVTVATGQLAQDAANDLYARLGAAPSQQVQTDISNLQNALGALQQSGATNTGPSKIVIQRAEQLDFALSATVPLIVPWAYSAYDAAKKNERAAQANFDVNEATVLYATAQSFFAAAGSDELLLARRHAIEVNEKTVDNAKARLEAGVVNRVEVTRAQLALLRAKQAMLEAGDSQVQAYRALRTIIQLDEQFRVVPEDVKPQAPESFDEQARSALKLRPEFAALERTIDAFDHTGSSNKWRWAPTLSGFGNVRAFNYPGFAGDNYSWAVGLSLDWLIYEGGLRDANVRLARAQADEQRFQLQKLRDTVTDDLYNARRALATKRSALDTAVQSVGLAKETLDLVRVQHDAGTATQLDLLTAQDALVTAEVQVAQARFDLALADLSLRRTAGTFPGH